MVKHKKRKKSKGIRVFFQIILGLFFFLAVVFLFKLLSKETLIWGIAITGIILLIGLISHCLKRKTIKDGVFKKLGV